MIASNSYKWATACYPKLPLYIVAEYLTMLQAYSPWTTVTSAELDFSMEKDVTWVFPFYDIKPEDKFDQDDFEMWVEMVEEELIRKHTPVINRESFCS